MTQTRYTGNFMIRSESTFCQAKLPADFKLPSVRTLSDELSTSRNTVETAYQELYAEGYIYTKPRSGYFVSGLDQDAAPLSLHNKPRKC